MLDVDANVVIKSGFDDVQIRLIVTLDDRSGGAEMGVSPLGIEIIAGAVARHLRLREHVENLLLAVAIERKIPLHPDFQVAASPGLPQYFSAIFLGHFGEETLEECQVVGRGCENFVICETVDHRAMLVARRGLIDASLVETVEFLFEIVEFLIAKAGTRRMRSSCSTRPSDSFHLSGWDDAAMLLISANLMNCSDEAAAELIGAVWFATILLSRTLMIELATTCDRSCRSRLMVSGTLRV